MNKILLAISILINMTLIITITGILPFLLFITTCSTIGLIWYIKVLISNINNINEDVEKLFDTFEDFSTHVEKIHGLEIFYGDETIQSLIEHSRDVLDEINIHRQKYFLSSEIVDTNIEEDEEGEFDFGPTQEKE